MIGQLAVCQVGRSWIVPFASLISGGHHEEAGVGMLHEDELELFDEFRIRTLDFVGGDRGGGHVGGMILGLRAGGGSQDSQYNGDC